MMSNSPTPRTPGHFSTIRRVAASRWSAFAGVAVVMTLMPLGVALADDFQGDSHFNGPVDFNTKVRMFGPVLMQSLGSSSIMLDVSASDTAIKARGSTAFNTSIGVDAGGATAVKATGKGAGVFATASDGTGVIGSGTGQFGTGVVGNGTFIGGQFSSTTGSAVSAGSNGKGTGVSGSSHDGLGGEFTGKQAPVRLVPAETQGAPKQASGAHKTGELYVDSLGDLYLCKQGGTPGVWVKVAITPAP